MLTLQNLALSQGPTVLVEGIHLSIFPGQIVGVTGRNGCGKSTLFSTILGRHEPYAGEVYLKKDLQISSLAQEVPALSLSALDYTISGNKALFDIFEKLKIAELQQDDEAIMDCHHALFENNGYGAEAEAAKILIGLGFSQEDIYRPVSHFSGGWRMRLGLAQCLFSPNELLLLDEPTNHLELEAVIWLENYLKKYQGAILLISHDRDFLDNTVTHIAHIENRALKMYAGSYSSFEMQRAEQIALQNAQYKKQQAEISHKMKFVERFRSKASKAKQAQSRLKAIEKMERVLPIYDALPFRFHFVAPQKMPNPILVMQKIDLGYEDHVVLKYINLNIAAGERIGLLGVNGAGKSTFIKGVCGEIKPLYGEIQRSSGVAIGYFAQHLVDHLSQSASPLELMRDIHSNKSEKEIITYLGGFGFGRDQSLSPLKNFSGGEKAKVALALIISQRPNLLLLDEPANHLDLEMREALTLALQEYTGAMILVSHDRYLMRSLVDELYLIEKGSVKKFEGSVEDYQQRYQ